MDICMFVRTGCILDNLKTFCSKRKKKDQFLGLDEESKFKRRLKRYFELSTLLIYPCIFPTLLLV